MTAARIRAQFPTSDGFGYQLKGCCRPPFVWASYNISRYIGRHSSRENNVPYCSHYSSSNTVPIIQIHLIIFDPLTLCPDLVLLFIVTTSLCQDWVIHYVKVMLSAVEPKYSNNVTPSRLWWIPVAPNPAFIFFLAVADEPTSQEETYLQ